MGIVQDGLGFDSMWPDEVNKKISIDSKAHFLVILKTYFFLARKDSLPMF